MPIGASSKAERKRSSASASAACDCMRSATSRTVAWVSTSGAGARVADDAQPRLDPHRRRSARRIRWVIETGASSPPPSTAADAGGVVLVDEVGERAPEQRLGLEPEQVAAGGRRVADRAVRLEHADQVGGGLGEHARARLRLEAGAARRGRARRGAWR